METLFNGQEIKGGKLKPLTKLPSYTSEMYINDILELFYVDSFNEKRTNMNNIFNSFKVIDDRSMKEDSNIKFINKIKPYNLNIIERFILIQLAVAQLQDKFLDKKRIISKLIELKIAKPIEIINVFNKNSNILKNKCIEDGKHFVEIKKDLFYALLNLEEEQESNKNNKDEEYKIIDINPSQIYNQLNSYVIGQQEATKNIVAGIYEHILKCKLNKDKNKKNKLDKTNTLIIGHTGTGKTFICNTLSKLLNVPIYVADASQFTESGYVGLSADSILTALAKQCREQMKGSNKFPLSIIYIDEIDKIAISCENERNSIGNRGVQEELLKILESDKYLCNGGRFEPETEYDISNVMFILGGAFSGLDKIIETRLNKNKENKIGFNLQQNKLDDKINMLQQVTTEDLINYGFMPEFLGRLTNKAILNPLTKQNLINILTTGKNNIIEQYKEVFLQAGIKLNILDETIDAVAQQAIDNNTGARGLRNTLSNVLNKVLFDASIDKREEYTLTPEVFY